jgi:hypothetical protein
MLQVSGNDAMTIQTYVTPISALPVGKYLTAFFLITGYVIIRFVFRLYMQCSGYCYILYPVFQYIFIW